MAESLQRRSPSDREVEQAIVGLKKGAYLLKCGRRGKPKLRPFRLSSDEKILFWYSGEREKHLKLHTVSKVVLGQQTVNFLRHNQGEKELQSFSLVYENGQRSLDLICKDKEQAESWHLGLKSLISASRLPKPLAYIKSSRGAHSCVSSPVGCKSMKQGALSGSAKLSKVRSLYGSPARSLLDRHVSSRMLDSCDEYYSPRQRTLSDVQSYLDKILPHLPHVVSDSEKETRNANLSKRRTIQTCKSDVTQLKSPFACPDGDLKDIFIWGKGVTGKLGGGLNTFDNKGTETDSWLPKLLEMTHTLDIQSLSCGDRHAALVTKQGEVFTWGEENGGRLGHKISMDVSNPKLVESLAGCCIKTVACGAQSTCVVTDNGELYVWGDSNHGFGLSGVAGNSSQWIPHRLCGSLNGIQISRIACGAWHTAIVSSDGQLFTYGDGTFGVLGHGDVKCVFQPKEVENLKGLRVKSVACGPWHTAAIVEILVGQGKNSSPGGKLFTWGDNDKGRLGHADKERKLVPTSIASLLDNDFIQVCCGTMFTVALTVTGIVVMMGSSMNGQFGNLRTENSSIATVEGLLKNEYVRDISSGSSHVAALTIKGQVYTLGKGEHGQLGLGDNRDRRYPALVEALEDRHVASVSCGSNFTVVSCLCKSISCKDQFFCCECKMSFGFSRKRHNCYNCGFMFCNSCSSRKILNAALAPNNSKKFRVCDSCFTQLRKTADPKSNPELASPRPPSISTPKGTPDLKIKKGQAFFNGSIPFLPKLLAINEFKLLEENTEFMQERALHATADRWGHVPCPLQFMTNARESSFKVVPVATEEPCNTGHVQAQCSPSDSKPPVPKTMMLRQELSNVDKMLIEELCQLNTEAVTLTQQCKIKSLKLQQYKRRIEETWLLAKDEAAKCKAAKDVVKILTNQINALSEKLSARRQISNVESISMPSSTQTKLPLERGDEDSVCECIKQPANIKDAGRESDGIGTENETMKQEVSTRPSRDTLVAGCDTRRCLSKETKNEWIEQDEAGVYITLTILPSGQKGLKRVRFSRKYFSEKEAETWWQQNQRRIYVKYNIEQLATPATN